MGNYRFKLSDMMPNAWFYKLRDMGRTRNQTQTQTTQQQRKKKKSTTSNTSKSKQPHQTNPRKSYYFTRELNQTSNNNIIYNTSPEQPRKSSSKQQRPKIRTPKTSSSTSSPLDSFSESESPDPEIRTDRVLLPTNDIIIDVDNNSLISTRKDDKLNGYDSLSELMKLPPIVTKPENFNYLLNYTKKKQTKPRSKISSNDEHNVKGSLKVKILKDEEQRNINTNTPSRRFSMSSPSVKLRINSPRLSSKKIQSHGRKSVSSTTTSSAGNRRSLSDSLAIVKSSMNPQRDFRESMVEMIVQNNIRTSKDLEDLLACYLSLNSDEYHELIIKVFKQIWFDLTDNQ
ncbi:transcription repressor OFP1-like [Trifolium pratense]|uniref:transcription repressor OFP1-like n=1 Tax=Trifolium pratense TaxID=57577 RepID=UPI001E691655|nr:transcription repressor OFP1-like [Trifolium pratense]